MYVRVLWLVRGRLTYGYFFFFSNVGTFVKATSSNNLVVGSMDTSWKGWLKCKTHFQTSTLMKYFLQSILFIKTSFKAKRFHRDPLLMVCSCVLLVSVVLYMYFRAHGLWDRKVSFLKDKYKSFTYNGRENWSCVGHQMHVSILFKCCKGANSFLHYVVF